MPVIVVSSWPGKSLTIVSYACRAWFEGGSWSTSPLARRSCRNGVPASSSAASAGTMTSTGRFITHSAIECHAPVPSGFRRPRYGTRRRSTRGPRIETNAGRKGRPVEAGDADDDSPRRAHRGEEGALEEEHRRQADGDGEAGEEH